LTPLVYNTNMTPTRKKFWQSRMEENAIVLYLNVHDEPVMQQHGYTWRLSSNRIDLEVGLDK
jgi:hypothetical protein